jgi:hypothetical protein
VVGCPSVVVRLGRSKTSRSVCRRWGMHYLNSPARLGDEGALLPRVGHGVRTGSIVVGGADGCLARVVDVMRGKPFWLTPMPFRCDVGVGGRHPCVVTSLITKTKQAVLIITSRPRRPCQFETHSTGAGISIVAADPHRPIRNHGDNHGLSHCRSRHIGAASCTPWTAKCPVVQKHARTATPQRDDRRSVDGRTGCYGRASA